MKEKLNYALKEDNYEKLDQKELKDQWLNLQELTDNNFLELATLKSSTRLNMQRLREEHDEVINDAKDNGTTKNIEELEKLCHTP